MYVSFPLINLGRLVGKKMDKMIGRWVSEFLVVVVLSEVNANKDVR